MKFKVISSKNREELKRAKRETWHRWWAWYPIKIEDEHGNFTVYWLTRVLRRGVIGTWTSSITWYYKETEFDLLKDKQDNLCG